MEFKNARKMWGFDYQSRQMLPKDDDIQVAGYVRLLNDDGHFFWARVMRRNGKELILTSDESLPAGSLRRGDEVRCSTGCVFGVV